LKTEVFNKRNWDIVTFKEVAKNFNKTLTSVPDIEISRYVGLEHLESDKLKINSWGDIEEGISFNKVFKRGHILFGKRRVYLRKVAIADFDGLCSGDILVFEVIPNQIHSSFFPFIVQSDAFLDYAIKTSAGSLSPRTKWKDLAQFQFRLPSIEEQTEIAQVLEKIEDTIERTEHQEKSLLNYKKGLLNELFHLNGNLGTLIKPTDCKTVKFGEVVKQIKTNVDPETSGLERFVAGEHMQTNDLKIRSWGIIGEEYIGSAFIRKFTKGQVLYGSRRTYLRKVAVPDFDGICANTTFISEAKKGEFSQRLLPYLMHSESFTQHSVNNSKGSTNPYINWKDIAFFEFPLPPLILQEKAADLFEAIDDVIEQTKQHHEKLLAFKKGLLNELIG